MIYTLLDFVGARALELMREKGYSHGRKGMVKAGRKGRKRRLTVKELRRRTGGTGKASKMPGHTYGTSNKDCQTGSVLAKIPGTPCHDCYAGKGFYTKASVIQAHKNRMAALLHSPQWGFDMLSLIALKCAGNGETFFRWDDSGDIQSLQQLEDIVSIAQGLPWVEFWLPTQQDNYLQLWVAKHGAKNWPSNLSNRLSGRRYNEAPAKEKLARLNVNGSLVSTDPNFKWRPSMANVLRSDHYECPAWKQNNECGPCRTCWDKGVKLVAYPKH